MLEYDKIKEELVQYAVSEMARDKINNLEPSRDIREIEG